jgi:uncharacterized lipoprotein YddW (UPF0748 family)
MRAAVAELARLNFNTLYPVVWNGGYAWYPSEVTQRRGLQAFTPRGLQGQDTLAELVAEAHARGLLVVPWFEFGFMAPPGMELASRHPDWLSRARDGSLTSISAAGEVAWLNPFRPEVQQLITELVEEIVERSGADGIQFDDHMSLPSQFGYDPFTTALYQRETRRPVPADPRDPAWLKWRADRITGFMARLHAAVNAKHPGALVSLSPNYHDFAYKLQLQHWREWVRRGIVDELLVQLYRPDLESFVAELERPELAESLARIPVGVGIMAGQRTRSVPIALVSAQAEAARARGLGLAFFYFETLWQRSEEPAALRQEALGRLFPTSAPRRLTQPPPPVPPSPPPPPALPGAGWWVPPAALADRLTRQRLHAAGHPVAGGVNPGVRRLPINLNRRAAPEIPQRQRATTSRRFRGVSQAHCAGWCDATNGRCIPSRADGRPSSPPGSPADQDCRLAA